MAARAALHLALLTLGVPAGSRVIAPSYACAALLNAIDAVGATPLLAIAKNAGEIAVSSTLGEGACFSISLPRPTEF